MSEENEDFLTIRLGDIVAIDNNVLNSQEEAVPWICWGRGGARPTLSKLNLKRFLEISARNDLSTAAETQVKKSPAKLPTFVNNSDSIMESITSECYDVLGNSRTDKHIADWLQQNFSEAIENKDNGKQLQGSFQEPIDKDSIQLINSDQDTADSAGDRTDINNDILHKSNQANNTDIEEKRTVAQFLLKHTTDPEYNDMLYQMPRHTLSSSMDKQCNSKPPPPGLTSFDKRNIRCVPNRTQSFTIENLPNDITRNELKQVLNSFGIVENILIRESEGNVTATVRMNAECDCSWIIECLNGTQPFGGSNR